MIKLAEKSSEKVVLEDFSDHIKFFDRLDNELKKIEIESSGHEFRVIWCSNCGYEHVIMLNCGDRTCPICRRKWYGYHYKTLNRVFRNWVKHKCCMKLELTLKNYTDQDFDKDKLKYLRRCFRALLRRNVYPDKKKSQKFKDLIQGGFYFIHLTNIGNGWHLHMHIIFKGEQIEHKLIKDAWNKITKDSYIVYIQRVKNAGKAIRYLLGDLLQRPKIPEDGEHLYNYVLKGSRLVQGFGSCARIKFKRTFFCPQCGNDHWICPNYELNKFHREMEYDTS